MTTVVPAWARLTCGQRSGDTLSPELRIIAGDRRAAVAADLLLQSDAHCLLLTDFMATRDELKLCGLTAVRARFQRDAESIQRLYFDQPTGRKIGLMCKALAASRKIYRCVEPAELEKIAGSVHHGGIVAVVAAPALREPTRPELRRWAGRRSPVLVLDRIGNAHNLGAIVRSAAFFGVDHVVLPAHPSAALPNDAAYRVAEGGLEHVTVWRTENLVACLRELAGVGYDVIGAATRGGAPTVPSTAPLALVLGNEENGLAPEVAACTRLVTIPSSGRVESLNVSVAAGVLLFALGGRGAAPSEARTSR